MGIDGMERTAVVDGVKHIVKKGRIVCDNFPHLAHKAWDVTECERLCEKCYDLKPMTEIKLNSVVSIEGEYYKCVRAKLNKCKAETGETCAFDAVENGEPSCGIPNHLVDDYPCPSHLRDDKTAIVYLKVKELEQMNLF